MSKATVETLNSPDGSLIEFTTSTVQGDVVYMVDGVTGRFRGFVRRAPLYGWPRFGEVAAEEDALKRVRSEMRRFGAVCPDDLPWALTRSDDAHFVFECDGPPADEGLPPGRYRAKVDRASLQCVSLVIDWNDHPGGAIRMSPDDAREAVLEIRYAQERDSVATAVSTVPLNRAGHSYWEVTATAPGRKPFVYWVDTASGAVRCVRAPTSPLGAVDTASSAEPDEAARTDAAPSPWPLAIGAALLLAAGVGVVLLRRRR